MFHSASHVVTRLSIVNRAVATEFHVTAVSQSNGVISHSRFEPITFGHENKTPIHGHQFATFCLACTRWLTAKETVQFCFSCSKENVHLFLGTTSLRVWISGKSGSKYNSYKTPLLQQTFLLPKQSSFLS